MDGIPPTAPTNSTDTRDSADGKRRYLTLLFSDLSESTRLSDTLEAEHYAQMLALWRALCRRIVQQHGGQIARMQGDGVLAFFGYPQAREDDARRAVEAALALHAEVRALAVAGSSVAAGMLSLHSGVHAGLVFVSDGDVERGRFELLGNPPNIAARLSSLAEADDIVVSVETLGPQLQRFAVSEPEAAAIKGRSEPLPIVRVWGQREQLTAPALADERRPLVGRQNELTQLRLELRLAMAGRNRCVTLNGTAGMGKSRLTRELVRHAQNAQARVLRGECENHFSAEPLQPFAQMLRTLAETGEPGALEALSALTPARAGQALAQAAQRTPMVMLVDDWQWADDASRQALETVRQAPAALLIVLATREVANEADADAAITLAPFSPSDTAQAVASLWPGADPFAVEAIHQHSGGTPLFVEELSRVAAGEGAAALQRLGTGSAWLATVVEARLAQLPASVAELARVAAVIGNHLPTWLLAEVCQLTEQGDALALLRSQEVLVPDETPGHWRFKHGLTREVIYKAVGLHERQALHLHIARVLTEHGRSNEQEDLAEALAYHCSEGHWHGAAADHAEQAGDKAQAASALDRARAQYGAALQALDALADDGQPQPLRWCAVAEKLAMACVFDPLALPEGVHLFERAVQQARICGDARVLARALYWLAYIHYAKGHPRQAALQGEAALAQALHVGDERLAAKVRGMLGQALHTAAKYPRALLLLNGALGDAQRQARPATGAAVGAAYSLACKGSVLGDQGEFDAAEACFEEAMHLLGGGEHQVAASVRHWYSVMRLWQGRWAEAQRLGEEAARIAGLVRSRQQLAMGRAMAGYARWKLTNDAADLQVVRDATAWVEASKGGLATSLNHAWMVEGALAQGRQAEARHHLHKLWRRVRLDDRLGEALACRAWALHLGSTAQHERAARYLQRAERSAAARGSAHETAANRLCAAQLAQWAQQPARVAADLKGLHTTFEALGMRWHQEQALQLEGAETSTGFRAVAP